MSNETICTYLDDQIALYERVLVLYEDGAKAQFEERLVHLKELLSDIPKDIPVAPIHPDTKQVSNNGENTIRNRETHLTNIIKSGIPSK